VHLAAEEVLRANCARVQLLDRGDDRLWLGCIDSSIGLTAPQVISRRMVVMHTGVRCIKYCLMLVFFKRPTKICRYLRCLSCLRQEGLRSEALCCCDCLGDGWPNGQFTPPEQVHIPKAYNITRKCFMGIWEYTAAQLIGVTCAYHCGMSRCQPSSDGLLAGLGSCGCGSGLPSLVTRAGHSCAAACDRTNGGSSAGCGC
jgi:hypothetical protein